MNKRTWLYHQTVPLGAIFHDEAIDQAKKAGWVDSPQKFVEKPIIKEIRKTKFWGKAKTQI